MTRERSPGPSAGGSQAAVGAGGHGGDLAVGRSVAVDFAVSADEMATFRRLTGDTNPLHFDPAFARARGLEGPVVFGGAVVARISGLLGSALPGPGCLLHSLAIKFRAPLYVGEPARLTATVAYWNPNLRVLRLALKVTAAGRTVIDGTAQASVLAPKG